ncbi:hypothetical protein ACHAWF_014091 [Thalassiosira exigua]
MQHPVAVGCSSLLHLWVSGGGFRGVVNASNGEFGRKRQRGCRQRTVSQWHFSQDKLFSSSISYLLVGNPYDTILPAPAAGGLFGATPAAAPATLQQQQYPQMPLSGNTPYSQLPDNAKRAIDQIYQLMMQHRRTLASVKTMAPSLLDVEDGAIARQNLGIGGELPSPADAAAGSPRRPEAVARDTLKGKTAALRNQIQDLLRSAESNLAGAEELKVRAGEAAAAAKVHGAWPVEGVAARRGVALSTAPAPGPAPTAGGAASSANVTGMPDAEAAILQRVLDARAARVDRVEAMPSPYFWEVLRDFERRVEAVHRDVEAVRSRLAVAEEAERLLRPGARADEASATGLVPYDGGVGAADAPLPRRLAALARSQNDLFLRTAARAAHAHDALEQAKARYQRLARASRGGWYDDPFLRADAEEVRREREVRDRIAEERLATAPPPPAAPVAAPAAGGAFGQPAPAPVTGGLFGAPAPAAGGGLFGQPAPAPAAGGLFGTPAPAPAGGLFGAPTPAPAPVGAGLFGSTATPTPAPAGGGLFGSTATPAPAPAGGGLFGSTATPAPAGKFSFAFGRFLSPSMSRASHLLAVSISAGGGLFGSAAPGKRH